jgi:hypothetical protein
MAADLVTIIETVTVTQLLTPTGKALGETVLERGKQMASTAVAYLAALGRQPQAVAEKLLVPMALGAGLESDPTLAEKWAALLANAADPTQNAQVQPGFIEVLRQLTPLDARILTHIYALAQVKEEYLPHYEPEAVITQRMASDLGVTDRQLALSVDTLLQLRLCAQPTRRVGKGEITGPSAATLQVCPTIFGHAFLAAVTPPA